MERDVVNIFWQIHSLFIHSLFIFIHSFSCEFCKICKNTFFHRTRPVAASIINVHSHLSNTIYTMLPMYSYILLKKAKKKTWYFTWWLGELENWPSIQDIRMMMIKNISWKETLSTYFDKLILFLDSCINSKFRNVERYDKVLQVWCYHIKIAQSTRIFLFKLLKCYLLL